MRLVSIVDSRAAYQRHNKQVVKLSRYMRNGAYSPEGIHEFPSNYDCLCGLKLGMHMGRYSETRLYIPLQDTIRENENAVASDRGLMVLTWVQRVFCRPANIMDEIIRLGYATHTVA